MFLTSTVCGVCGMWVLCGVCGICVCCVWCVLHVVVCMCDVYSDVCMTCSVCVYVLYCIWVVCPCIWYSVYGWYVVWCVCECVGVCLCAHVCVCVQAPGPGEDNGLQSHRQCPSVWLPGVAHEFSQRKVNQTNGRRLQPPPRPGRTRPHTCSSQVSILTPNSS